MPAIIVILFGLWILTIGITIFWNRQSKHEAWWRDYYKTDRDKANEIIHNDVEPLRFHILKTHGNNYYYCILVDDTGNSIYHQQRTALRLYCDQSNDLEDIDRLKEKAVSFAAELKKEAKFIMEDDDDESSSVSRQPQD